MMTCINQLSAKNERVDWVDCHNNSTFYVSEVDYDYIMNKIENPDPPSDALKKLFERKIPWDTK